MSGRTARLRRPLQFAEAAQKAAQSPALKQRLEADGATPVGNDPTAFAVFVRDDVKRWAPAVKRPGATPQ